MLGTTALSVSSVSSAETILVGQLVNGTGVLPGTTIIADGSGTGSIGTYLVGVPQLVGTEVINVFAGAAIEGSVSGTILNVQQKYAGSTIGTSQLLSGAGISAGTTIASSLGGGSWSVNNPQTVALEPINLLSTSTTATTGSWVSNGTSTTVSTATSLTIGQALFGNGLLPGSYVASASGMSPYTVGVLQVVGSATEPVAVIAQSGVVVAGYIGSATGVNPSQTLTVLQAISGSLATATGGYPVIGAGVGANTYLTGALSSSTFQINNLQSVASSGSPEVMIAPAGAALVGSISGTLLTVLANSSGTLSAGQVLSGSGILPGTSVTGAISTSGGLGVYSIGVSQLVNSAAAQQTMTVVPSVEFLGSISGTTLVVAPTGTLAIGQIINHGRGRALSGAAGVCRNGAA
ncbi:MAG: hypothetical protein WDN04_22975 [Rhodospirillales bacterium]